ncbi:akt1 substrate 1 protein [Anaeramoeba ignava]|uniref:Akt1 substrate 1 protein n=1 Tax=Anaeramoeba ignava TaxID=1746090 RepID=A0A9Q0LPR9_ANAIG|nr:akt1 substrate 1 protein [Anaeramoeba ignava]
MHTSFYCDCLNIKLSVFGITQPKTRIQKRLEFQLKETNIKQPYFAKLQNIEMKHSLLMQKRIVNEWTVFRCQNCDRDIYAISSSNTSQVVIDFLQANKDPAKIYSRHNYSKLFEILLPEPTPYNTKTPKNPHLFTNEKRLNKKFQNKLQRLKTKIHLSIQKKRNKNKNKNSQEIQKYANKLQKEMNIFCNQVMNKHNKTNLNRRSLEMETNKKQIQMDKLNTLEPEEDFSTVFTFDFSPKNSKELRQTKSSDSIEELELIEEKLIESPPIFSVSAPIPIEFNPHPKITKKIYFPFQTDFVTQNIEGSVGDSPTNLPIWYKQAGFNQKD